MASVLAQEWRIGAGFNPGYLSGHGDGLRLVEEVRHLELGLAELHKWKSTNQDDDRELSLHLARTPITESWENQDHFIKQLHGQLNRMECSGEVNLVSVGIHLTGERCNGIGRFGFSSHYSPSVKTERNAVRFIRQIQDKTGLPVWIENANFYSSSFREICACWKSTEKICRTADAKIIVDLSHLYIDAMNITITPEVLLGLVPWDEVIELHLSGIVRGGDGSVHDGHSMPVDDKVWALLRQVRKTLHQEAGAMIVSIEHSDPVWITKRNIHDEDFEKLKKELAKCQGNIGASVADKSDVYAKSYLMKLLKQWIPKVEPACAQRMISFEGLVLEWLDEIVERRGSRIVMTQDEVSLNNAAKVDVAAASFAEFARKRIEQCDAA